MELQSLGDLFAKLTHEMRTLVVQELRLARTEVSEKVTQVERGVSALALGGAILFAGLLTIIACAVIALALVVQLWLSALIVGLVVSAIGFFMVASGRESLKKENLELKRTRESLKEDRQWAKAQIR